MFLQILCLTIFFFLVALPACFGFHMYVLMILANRKRAHIRAEQAAEIERYQTETKEEDWPYVTTQLPLYNELSVARRVIEAAAHMDYPRNRHEVQVLDDSTDETRHVVDQTAADLRAQGYNVQVVRRPERTHYKAGALAHGLPLAQGEYVAVFDADFVPNPGFLRRMIPLIDRRPDVCVIQGRWGHLNSDESWITESLALSLDMHFAIEQGARNWNNIPMSFNGTGGIWRRSAIDDPRVGGWHGDTITEDLDLSYRAQLAGWKMRYCADEVSPAELPADAAALKAQQRRWATGTIQTARKLLPIVWRSKRFNLFQKIEATIHMTQYAIAVPMVLVALVGRLIPVVLIHDQWMPGIQTIGSVFLLAAVAPCIAYIMARRAVSGRMPSALTVLKLFVMGLGLSINNAVAVLVGLGQKGGEFVRTPKSGSTDRRIKQSAYSSLRSQLWMVEIFAGAWCLAQAWTFWPVDGFFGVIFLLLYAAGFLAIGWSSRPSSPSTATTRQRRPVAVTPKPLTSTGLMD